MIHKRPSLIDKDVAFRRYYNRHLQPLEQHFEEIRLKAVRDHILRIVAALASWLASLASIVYLASPIGEFWWFIGFFALATAYGLGVWAWLPAGAHRLRLQEQVLSRIVPFFGNLQYRSEPDLIPRRYSDWMLLPKFEKTEGEDQIEGTYQGVSFKLAEMKFKYEYRTSSLNSSSSNNSSSTRIPFKGLMIDFELGEEFPGVTLIRTIDSDMNGDFSIDPELKEVSTGSHFEVFSTQDAPGTKIADPRFLDQLAKVSEQFEARQLFASFHANKLVMLIEHKGNLFEMSHRKQTNFAQDAERVRDQLGLFFAIVDLLQLRGKAEEESGKHNEVASVPVFPEIQENKADERYDIGGWGCLTVFILFAAIMAAYLYLLDSTLSKGALLWWSALGGFLSSIGLWQTINGVLKLSIGTLIFSFILLAGAFAVLYYYVPPETQELFRSWLPIK